VNRLASEVAEKKHAGASVADLLESKSVCNFFPSARNSAGTNSPVLSFRITVLKMRVVVEKRSHSIASFFPARSAVNFASGAFHER